MTAGLRVASRHDASTARADHRALRRLPLAAATALALATAFAGVLLNAAVRDSGLPTLIRTVGGSQSGPSLVATQPAPGEPPVPFRIHTVQAGETVASIAERYAISPEAVMRNNGLAIDEELVAGSGLFVPAEDGLLYTVLDGALTGSELAARLGLTPDEVRPVAADAWGLALGRTVLVRLPPARLAAVTSPLDEEARLDRAGLERVAAGGSQLTLRPGGLSWPASGRIAQLFWEGHTGLDIAAPAGAPILAPADGVVTFEGWTPHGGIAVCTTHDGGLESCAYHAAATLVDAGASVRRGQEIAVVGMTGLASGPHVHWQVRRSGVLVNPLGE